MKSTEMKKLFPDIDPGSVSFLAMFDQFHEGVVITDRRGRILYFNEAQARIDDLDPDEVTGRSVSDLYRVDDDDTPIMKCINSGRPINNFTCYYRTRLGKIVNSIHNVFPLFSHGSLIGAVCFVTDFRIAEQTFETISTLRTTHRMNAVGLPARPPAGSGARYTFEEIIGKAPEFLKAAALARMASDTPSSIMLYGETGTGKELFAQAIHNASSRKARPFVAINCAAIPEHLLEGILFGTARGAFTGAMDKPGLFEEADGGTLFLDEINSMSLGLQAKLLRVIQERRVRRVGAMKEHAMDLRLISSVNEDPHEAAERGGLRHDLLHRLGVMVIRIPPLRERMGDLEKLIRHFLHKHNAPLKKQISAISADVLDLFHNYRWPGNVRELEHAIEGAAIQVQGNEAIDLRHLPDHITRQAAPPPGGRFAPASGPPLEERINVIFSPEGSAPEAAAPAAGMALTEIQAANERRTICKMLARFQGNASRAARELALSPQLLHYKMKKHRIRRKDFLP